MNELLKEDIEPPLAQDLSKTELIFKTGTTEGKLFKDSEIVLSGFNIINTETAKFRAIFFPQATDIQWNGWKWQIQNSYINFGELSEILDISEADDEVTIMLDLMHKAFMNRINPYYLYQHDPILDSSHFGTSVSKGLEIIQGLNEFTNDYSIPCFVVNTTDDVKTPLLPKYYQSRYDDNFILKNFDGKTYKYYDTI
ncbi:hypothetical protein [Lutibacter sp.]|uniref:hypothetical protein n=1 Tax=Lutibacter sp. TaxID=1925666 RepID=UPI003568560E